MAHDQVVKLDDNAHLVGNHPLLDAFTKLFVGSYFMRPTVHYLHELMRTLVRNRLVRSDRRPQSMSDV